MVTRHETIHTLMESGLGDSVAVHHADDLVQTPGSGGLWLLEDKEPSSPVLEFADIKGESDHFDCSTESPFIDFALIGDRERGARRAHHHDCRTVSSNPSLDFILVLLVSQIKPAVGSWLRNCHIDGPPPLKSLLSGNRTNSWRGENFTHVVSRSLLTGGAAIGRTDLQQMVQFLRDVTIMVPGFS